MRPCTAVLGIIGCVALLHACGGGGDPGRFAYVLGFDGLPELPAGRGHYESWVILPGGLVRSTGKFTIDASVQPSRVRNIFGTPIGTTVSATFGPASTGLGSLFPFVADAESVFVTVERQGDNDALPSGLVLMAGRFVGNVATFGPAGLLGEMPPGPGLGVFVGTSGQATLANPTGNTDADANGLWFVSDASTPSGTPGLVLPDPAGAWVYEGWVSNGVDTFSTGKFRATDMPDTDAIVSGTRGSSGVGFLAPGQDFVLPATVGQAPGPLELNSGDWRVEVTLEPEPDHDAGPSRLFLLGADIPTDAVTNGFSAGQQTLDLLATGLPMLSATATPGQLQFTGTAPPDLGSARAGHYACWVTSAGAAGPLELVARFRVQDATGQVTSVDGATVFGNVTSFVFTAANTGLLFPMVETAVAARITLEPQSTVVPGPSPKVLLLGDLVGGFGTLTVTDGVTDLTNAGGFFTLVSPTNSAPGVTADDQHGLWFISFLGGFPGLTLPELPAPWRYEGWVLNTMTGERWSTGRFSRPDTADEDATTWAGRGTLGTGFAAPGQDFITMSPGQTIPAPLDLTAGFTTFVTLEPVPDNDVGPFFLRVLEGLVPGNPLVPFPLNAAGASTAANGGTLPTGTAQR